MSLRTSLAAAAAAAVVLLAPVAAQAATKTVDMGLPLKSQKQFNQKLGTDVNDFFPHAVTIRAGDSVTFAPTAFHTVDLPPKGGKPLALFLPSGQKATGVVDAAGAPFWFNGQDQLSFTPDLLKGLYGKSVSFNGAKRVESGLPLAQKPKPFKVKFTKPGTYTYHCDVHAGMKGIVKVVAKGAAVPSAAADAKALKAQLAADEKTAKALANTKPPAGTVSVGASGKGGVEYFGFFPSTQTIPVGTTVKFAMSSGSYDVHTATTGPGDPEKDPASYLGKISGTFQGPGPFDPLATYPSDPPGTPASLTPTFHGNGFWSSGVLDTSAATPPPTASSVTFAAPGTYQFYCLIHPFMHATVTVQ